MTEALALTFQFTQADWKRVFMSVALRGLGNNAVNGGIDKRFKSPAFHAGVTGSNPVAVTIGHKRHNQQHLTSSLKN